MLWLWLFSWGSPSWRTPPYCGSFGNLLPAARHSSAVLTDCAQVAGSGLKYSHKCSCGDTFAKTVLSQSSPVRKRCVRGGIGWEADTSFSWLTLCNRKTELCTKAASWLVELLSLVDSIIQSVAFLIPTSFYIVLVILHRLPAKALWSPTQSCETNEFCKLRFYYSSLLLLKWGLAFLAAGYGMHGAEGNRLQVSGGKLGCPEVRIWKWIQTVQSTFRYPCTIQLKDWSVPPVAFLWCWWNHRDLRLAGLFMHSVHWKMDEADGIWNFPYI